jgi:hypothetical protein
VGEGAEALQVAVDDPAEERRGRAILARQRPESLDTGQVEVDSLLDAGPEGLEARVAQRAARRTTVARLTPPAAASSRVLMKAACTWCSLMQVASRAAFGESRRWTPATRAK